MLCYKKLNCNFENKDIYVSQNMIDSFGGSQTCFCLFAVVRQGELRHSQMHD